MSQVLPQRETQPNWSEAADYATAYGKRLASIISILAGWL
jgi:hypothetical protein